MCEPSLGKHSALNSVQALYRKPKSPFVRSKSFMQYGKNSEMKNVWPKLDDRAVTRPKARMVR